MKKYFCLFLSLIFVLTVLTGAAPAYNSDGTEDDIQIVRPIYWADRTIVDKFNPVPWQGNSYTSVWPSNAVESSLDKKLGHITIKASPQVISREKKHDPKLTDKDFIQDCNLYSIQGIPVEFMIAVEFIGYDGYRIHMNEKYQWNYDTRRYDETYEKSGTFDDVIQWLGFEYMAFEKKAYYLPSEKYIANYGKKLTSFQKDTKTVQYYSIKSKASQALMEKFLSFGSAEKRKAPDPNAKMVMQFAIMQKYVNWPATISLYDDGTMYLGNYYNSKTNESGNFAFIETTTYYIGEKNMNDIISYVINNCKRVS